MNHAPATTRLTGWTATAYSGAILIGMSSPTFSQAVRPMVDALRGLDQAYRMSTTELARLPSHDSPAMLEVAEQKRLANAVWAQPVDNAHSTAGIITFAGVDHLQSYARLFEDDRTPVFTHLAVARAALLAFAASAWLCEPGIGAATRVKRSLVLDLEDLENMGRYGLAELRERARNQKTWIRAGASLANWPIICSDKTRRVDGIEYPRTAEAIMGAVIDPMRASGTVDPDRVGRVVWAYLSGISHGFAFALLQSVQQAEDVSGVDGLAKGNFVTRSDSVNVMGLVLASAAVTACGRHLRLMGWATEAWEGAVHGATAWMNAFGNAAADRMGAPNPAMFA